MLCAGSDHFVFFYCQIVNKVEVETVTWGLQGRSQAKIPGVPEPHFWVMTIFIISTESRGTFYRIPLLQCRGMIYSLLKNRKRKLFWKSITCYIEDYMRLQYKRMRINWTDHATLLWYTSLQYGILHLCLSRPFKQRTLDHTSRKTIQSVSYERREVHSIDPSFQVRGPIWQFPYHNTSQ